MAGIALAGREAVCADTGWGAMCTRRARVEPIRRRAIARSTLRSSAGRRLGRTDEQDGEFEYYAADCRAPESRTNHVVSERGG